MPLFIAVGTRLAPKRKFKSNLTFHSYLGRGHGKTGASFPLVFGRPKRQIPPQNGFLLTLNRTETMLLLIV